MKNSSGNIGEGNQEIGQKVFVEGIVFRFCNNSVFWGIMATGSTTLVIPSNQSKDLLIISVTIEEFCK